MHFDRRRHFTRAGEVPLTRSESALTLAAIYRSVHKGAGIKRLGAAPAGLSIGEILGASIDLIQIAA